jgi:hypothetical protein
VQPAAASRPGPVIAPTGTPPGYRTLASYADEIVHPDGVPGLMAGSPPAAVLATHQAGQVPAIGPRCSSS